MEPAPLPHAETRLIRVALEPIYNTLHSLALLNETERLSGLNTWITRAAATLTPAQLHLNKLIFTGLRDAIAPEQDEPDFPTYLRHLAERDPIVLRDQVLEELRQRFSQRFADEQSMVAPSAARLLEDRQAYLTCVEYTHIAAPFEATLQAEVHALLNDAPSMLHLISEHFQILWQTRLASEWKRIHRSLESQVKAFSFQMDVEAPLEETFRAFTGREMPSWMTGRLRDVREIVLVPTWHSGRSTMLWENRDRTYLFFGEPISYDPAWRTKPIGRPELRVRLDALADETRLRIIELLAQQDELSAQEIIVALELSQSSVSRHLKQLVSTGYLVERRGESANKTYRLSSVAFDKTALALKRLPLGQTEEADTYHSSYAPELRRFVDREGRVTLWPPARERDKLIILEHLASFFEQGRFYSEQEVNHLLWQYSTTRDSAALRRALIEYRFVKRTRDGSNYWLIGTEGPEEESYV